MDSLRAPRLRQRQRVLRDGRLHDLLAKGLLSGVSRKRGGQGSGDGIRPDGASRTHVQLHRLCPDPRAAGRQRRGGTPVLRSGASGRDRLPGGTRPALRPVRRSSSSGTPRRTSCSPRNTGSPGRCRTRCSPAAACGRALASGVRAGSRQEVGFRLEKGPARTGSPTRLAGARFFVRRPGRQGIVRRRFHDRAPARADCEPASPYPISLDACLRKECWRFPSPASSSRCSQPTAFPWRSACWEALSRRFFSAW